MAKSKYAPALFEVIDRPKDAKTSGRLALPKWWKSGPAEPAPGEPEGPPEPEAPQAPDVPQAPETPDVAQALEAPEPGQAAAEEGSEPSHEEPQTVPSAQADAWAQDVAERPPVLRVRSGRVELSLNPVGTVVVVGGLLLALVFSYQLGRNFGASDKPVQEGAANGESTDVVEVEAARIGLPNPKVLEGSQPAHSGGGKVDGGPPAGDAPTGAGQPPTPAAPGQRVAGLNYMVLQIFNAGDKRAAEFARAWLAGRGIPATVESSGSKKWKLLSLQDFGAGNPADSPQYRRYRSEVLSLGKELAGELTKAGLSRYDLRAPYPQRYGK